MITPDQDIALDCSKSRNKNWFKDFILNKSRVRLVAYINFVFIYVLSLMWIANMEMGYWIFLPYLAFYYIVFTLRSRWIKSEITFITHRIPFFSHAVANALSVGVTLEQALRQSLSYLKGRYKNEFELAINRHTFGEDLGQMLKALDKKFPQTGLQYMITLVDEYNHLGVGISPLLRKIAEALKQKEAAEEKVRVILATGTNYAKLSILVFLAVFGVYGFILKGQLTDLFDTALMPVFYTLCGWAVIGLVVVLYISSVKFANHSALKPYIKEFMRKGRWPVDALFYLSGLSTAMHASLWRIIFFAVPLVTGTLFAIVGSWFLGTFIILVIYFFIGALFGKLLIEYYLKCEVEDELILVIENFPEFLRVFVIGLNSGLNKLKALRFAENSLKEKNCRLLKKEIVKAINALEFGQDSHLVWNRLGKQLPFEIITDFCEIMVTSSLYGDSVSQSILQMISSYDNKRLSLIEKKANKIGQAVIPIVIISFLPLFLVVIFGPLFLKIMNIFELGL